MDLPEAARWREWMGRVEAVIFAARSPVPREALARLVGSTCNLDDLIADIRDELRARPYELVFVAGGYQLRTKPRFAPAIRAASGDDLRDAGAPELTPTEILAVTAIAYLQPATRAELSRLAGREISRDVIGALKRHGLIDGALARAGARRAFRLCDDQEIPGGLRARDAARSSRHRTARRRRTLGAAADPRPISTPFFSREKKISRRPTPGSNRIAGSECSQLSLLSRTQSFNEEGLERRMTITVCPDVELRAQQFALSRAFAYRNIAVR